MNKKFIYLTSILAVAMAASIAVTAQESNATANNVTLNNTTLNDTILENATGRRSESDSAKFRPCKWFCRCCIEYWCSKSNYSESKHCEWPTDCSRSHQQIGSVAPLVAAGASSAQVASEPEGSFKIGTGVGGSDPFNPEHVEIETLKIGIPIKSMRDTGKMFFVCDIV